MRQLLSDIHNVSKGVFIEESQITYKGSVVERGTKILFVLFLQRILVNEVEISMVPRNFTGWMSAMIWSLRSG